jgi:hypothetical protein
VIRLVLVLDELEDIDHMVTLQPAHEHIAGCNPLPTCRLVELQSPGIMSSQQRRSLLPPPASAESALDPAVAADRSSEAGAQSGGVSSPWHKPCNTPDLVEAAS